MSEKPHEIPFEYDGSDNGPVEVSHEALSSELPEINEIGEPFQDMKLPEAIGTAAVENTLDIHDKAA